MPKFSSKHSNSANHNRSERSEPNGGRGGYKRNDRYGPSNNFPKRRGTNAWNSHASWYSGMVGSEGSRYHQALAFPYTLKLLNIKDGERILDIGCGTGVFSQSVSKAGGKYFGLDISKKMISEAKKDFAQYGKFSELDILRLQPRGDFAPESFDAVTFILSIQDMPDLEMVIKNASKLLKKGGRLVIFMKHPSFNIPRQSGWIEDEKRSLTSRRTDRYLTPLDMPLVKKLKNQTITTFHYHRALQDYMKYLTENKLSIYAFEELPDVILKDKKTAEFPLFLTMGAKKL